MNHLDKWLETRDTKHRDALIGEHTVMLRKMARAKWKGKLFDDFLGAAYLGAIKAINTFDPEKGKILEAHIYWQVKYELERHARLELKAAKHYTTLDDDTRHNELTCPSVGVFEALAMREDMDALKVALKTLPQEDLTILNLRVLEGMTLRDIATNMGLGYSLVIHRERSIIKRLRAVIEAIENPAY